MTPRQPDTAGAVLAIDQAMIALAVAKSVLLGETGRPIAQDLAAAQASPANPYGSTKHGEFTAANAAEVAEGRDELPIEPFPHFAHLPQHLGASPVCILCGIDHDAAARLSPPAPYGHQSLQPKEA